MKVQISKDLMDAILKYLIKQPYNEVAGLIDAVRSEAETVKEEEPNVPKTE